MPPPIFPRGTEPRHPPYMLNAFKDVLLSEDWCNLVFEGRNKDYGAYHLRQTAGERYRCVFIGLALLVGIPVLLFCINLGVTYVAMKSFQESMPTEKLKPLEVEADHELKAIATGRSLPRPTGTPGASLEVPDIVDKVAPSMDFGVDGPPVLETPEETFVRIPEEMRDTAHNEERKDLPVEGKQLTPTEVVECMPTFPGGWKALAKWLDEHILYPAECVSQKIQGDLEISIYVDEHGNVIEPSISKPLNPTLDEEALKAVKGMPKWEPGKVNGKVSIVHVRIPVHFEVQDLSKVKLEY